VKNNILVILALCAGLISSAQARMAMFGGSSVQAENRLTQMRIDQNRNLENARHEFRKLHGQVDKAQGETDSKIALQSLEHIEKENHAMAVKMITVMKNLFVKQADEIIKDEQHNKISLTEYQDMMNRLEKNYASDEAAVIREEADVVTAIEKAVANVKSAVEKHSYSLSHKEQSMGVMRN
jgi:hypothetical protein